MPDIEQTNFVPLVVRILDRGELFRVGTAVSCPCRRQDETVDSISVASDGTVRVNYECGDHLLLTNGIAVRYEQPPVIEEPEPLKNSEPVEADAPTAHDEPGGALGLGKEWDVAPDASELPAGSMDDPV
ncbi:MAG TPA: hypothetical protein VMY35_12435 [Phycisphaerae bacterium]|nr:hypothetical protein [Phycisphaerae bacterium]